MRGERVLSARVEGRRPTGGPPVPPDGVGALRAVLRALLVAAACLMAGAGSARADIVADIVARVPARPHSYAQVVRTLSDLRASGRVTLYKVGSSAGGHDLYGVVVKSPEVPLEQCARLLVIARQHGSEPSGTEAALALISHFAASRGKLETETLRRLAFIVVPVANPDGALAGRRGNGNGADLNRDWVRLSQPETGALMAAIRAWRPQAVMDLHELPAYSSKASYQENFIETIGADSDTPRRVTSHTLPTAGNLGTWLKAYGHRTNIYYDAADRDRSLCHRRCGLDLHIPSYLVETKTGSGRSLGQRAAFHVLCMLVVANHLIHNQVPGGAAPEMAATPPAPAPGPATEPTRVELMDVADGADEGRLQVEARVTPAGDNFVRFYVDGRLRAISNMEPFVYDLRASDLGAGEHAVSVEVLGPDGALVAQAARQVSLDETGLGGQ
jgi:hypothetical protein